MASESGCSRTPWSNRAVQVGAGLLVFLQPQATDKEAQGHPPGIGGRHCCPEKPLVSPSLMSPVHTHPPLVSLLWTHATHAPSVAGRVLLGRDFLFTFETLFTFTWNDDLRPEART